MAPILWDFADDCVACWGRTSGQPQADWSLMHLMGLRATYPKTRLSRNEQVSQKYPYLLRGLTIHKPNQVWATDITYINITYIKLRQGFIYLVAIMDWFSRYVLSWEVSNSLDTYFCLSALDKAFVVGKPEIFNYSIVIREANLPVKPLPIA
jgi:putative transposase